MVNLVSEFLNNMEFHLLVLLDPVLVLFHLDHLSDPDRHPSDLVHLLVLVLLLVLALPLVLLLELLLDPQALVLAADLEFLHSTELQSLEILVSELLVLLSEAQEDLLDLVHLSVHLPVLLSDLLV